ncbi:MAG: secondary thiamine-phosphate synthase enzyme YjbQ [bacterium]
MSAKNARFITYPASIELRTRGELDIVDFSSRLAAVVSSSGVSDGVVNVFVAGSTAAITTIEYESGAVSDLKAAISRLAPAELHYDHDAKWGDGNGRSHVRAAMIGPSVSLPVREGVPIMGTWQQIVLIELDLRSRDRRIYVTVYGTTNEGGAGS